MNAALGIVVGAIAFLLMLVVSLSIDRATRSRARRSRPTHPMSDLTLMDGFSPENAILWEIQMPVLQAIPAGVQGIGLGSCRRMYATLARTYPELFDADASGFNAWVELLQGQGIVDVRRGRVFITPVGREFLACWVLPPTPMEEFVGVY